MTTTVTGGAEARDTVVHMRKAHYQLVLDGLGVETWDRYDADATHFICFADGAPVASMRSTLDRIGSGEAAADFPDLASVLPGQVAEYLYLSRQLVVPEFRGIGLPAVITHSAASWWKSNSVLEYVVATSREPAVGNARELGGTVLDGPIHLGPGKMPVILVGVHLSALADRTKHLLGQHGWAAGRARSGPRCSWGTR